MCYEYMISSSCANSTQVFADINEAVGEANTQIDGAPHLATIFTA